ncbi:hypothetical protein B7P43_G04350 [Cryptotermes secundus]|uniref:Uncharacterized protein n=1 Tax=Cryptotermes secundus TaxID=105785 RepID=A0A2J7RE27_9NEOP|nr:hypothetical protein B7P43_G04350 [Cryptotermes secundus]
MERQSELDAAELEAADENPEKVARGTSDEDDEEEEEEEDEEEEEEEDIYEPYESYNYESRHITHPGNKLHNEDKHLPDKNWNSKRGYYIFHEPDHSPYDYYRPHRTHKDKRTRPYENNYYDYGHTEKKPEPAVSAKSQDPGKDYDDDGSSKQTQTPEDQTKDVTKDGTKGLYIQRPSSTPSTPPPSNRSKGDNKDTSSGKVLTYVVNQKTGRGAWISSDDDNTDTAKTTDTSEANTGEKAGADVITRVSVRGPSKSRNNWRKNGEAVKEQKDAEYQDQKPEVEETSDEQVESSGRNRNVPDNLKTNRGKPQTGKYSSDHDTERHRIDADNNSKPTNTKRAPQNRLRKNPGRPLQKDDNKETVAQSQDERSDLNKSDYSEKVKKSGKFLRGKAGEKEEIVPKDDGNEEGSDTSKLDGVSKSGKSHHRKNKSRRYRGRANQFENTDADASASEAKYYEEELPVATTHNDEHDEGYKHEISDEEELRDEDVYREETIASAFGKVPGQTAPKHTDYSEDVKEAVDDVPPYVKDPAERYYYYADETEVPGKEKKVVQADRISRSYTGKQLRRKDETVED